MLQENPRLLKAKSFELTVLFLSLLVLLAAQSAYSQNTEPPQTVALELSKPIEKDIAATEKHSYQITLAENQYAFITVEQRGIDVAVRVYNKTDDRAMVQRDLIAKADGREEVGFVASAAGVYRLEIEAKVLPAVTGRYTVLLAEVRLPNEKELRLEEARKLHSQSLILWRAGKFAEAIPVSERALEIRQKELGAEDLDVAASLANVGFIILESGDYEKGIPLLERALKMREKILGFDHLELAVSLKNLGEAYRVLGDFAKAEEFQMRALQIRETNFPANNPNIAASLSGLANVYLNKGDTDKALEFESRALSIWEKAFGPDHPNTALGLTGIGNANVEKGDYKSAEAYYLRALSVLQKNFKTDHPRVADAMGSLAILYTKQGDYGKAEPLFQQTILMLEKTVGKEHRNYALALSWLAVLYTDTGEYQKAEPLYQQAITTTEKLFGSQHPIVIIYLNNLARNYLAKGDTAQSVNLYSRAHKLSERNAQLILFTNSERQKVLFLDSLATETNQYVSAHLKFAPDDATALELALTTIFERKGRVSDAMALDFAALRNRFNKDDQALLDQLREATSRLARRVLNERQNIAPGEYQKQIKELEEQKEKLEIEVSRRSSEFRLQIQPVTIPSIQSAIPENAALVEFSIYRPFDPKAVSNDKAFGEPRYVAYVVRKEGKIQWKDLGLAKTIDDAVENFRQSLRDPKRKDAQTLARAVDEKVMQPVRSLTGGASQLLISPDGDLNLIPFEALMDEQNRYLVESYSFGYLTSGRDLLRMQISRESKSKSLVIANPTFGEPLAGQTAVNTTRKGKRQSITATRNLSDTYFAPLGGTLQEARSIQTLFPEASFLTGAQATESALKQTTAPRILHIATHGFFLQDTEISAGGNSQPTMRAARANAKTENPLLRSGLALAGANQRGGTGDDGILTALEASGLNLWGTKLVVLSACDTGIGEVKNGEGVYGLRRAFVLAGAETLMMSLWSVSDYVTRELMTNYYKNLKQGMGRGAALRQVQLEMLKKNGRQHPFYWAGFIQSGEWANLDGKR